MTATLELDRLSLLVNVAGTATLREVEQALRAESLTLGVVLEGPNVTVADWLARGAPGAPSHFDDPADHLLAGLTATLQNGRRLEIHPSPRRAVGPDLTALVVGAGERFAKLDSAWLRVRRLDETRRLVPFAAPDAPVSDGEAAILDAIARALQ